MTEKTTYITPDSGGFGGNGFLAGAMMNGGMGMNGAWPMMAMMNGGFGGFGGAGIIPWLFLLFLRNGWNGGEGCGCGLQNQLSAIQETINNNQGNNALMAAITGGTNDVRALANTINFDFNAVQQAINGVQSAVCQVGNQVGMSGLQTINAIQQGNMQLAQQLAQCCCDNKLLASQNHGALMSRIDQLANGITQGFSATAYETQRQTCDILNAGNANTQRIIDTLNNHWQADLQQRYNDVRLELSQKAQNEYLVGKLSPNCGCNC